MLEMTANKGKTGKVVSLKLYEDEENRFNELFKRAQSRNPYINASILLRELLGLNDSGLLTPEDKLFFAGMDVPVIDARRAKDKRKK